MSGEVQKWADVAMFHAEPQEAWDERTGVQPRVHLLSMNADPLGDVASMAMIYEGKVARSLKDVTDEQRKHYFDEMLRTHLHTPLEAIKLHLLFEGVDRAFTHQLVRTRIASYAQESMRFAVPGALNEATTLPPSLFGTPAYGQSDSLVQSDAERMRFVWDDAIEYIDNAYHRLVNMGMPAEEARGLLPTAVATRIHQVVDLQTLVHHAGNRLCTQAQFHWRSVFNQIVEQIRNYAHQTPVETTGFDQQHRTYIPGDASPNAWQFKYIADSGLFKPVCYQLGKCPFKAEFDRGCTIRKRVDLFAKEGVPSSEWGEDYLVGDFPKVWISAIHTEEWLLNPRAAVVKPS